MKRFNDWTAGRADDEAKQEVMNSGYTSPPARPSIRPSVNLHCLTAAVIIIAACFDWIGNKTWLQNCGLLVPYYLGKASERRRLENGDEQKTLIFDHASSVSWMFEFSLVDIAARDGYRNKTRQVTRVAER